MSSLARYRGGCLCGGVTFELDAKISKAGMCHCGKCRGWNGGTPWFAAQVCLGVAPAKPAPGLPPPLGRVTSERDLVWWRSSLWGERGFCRQCGCSMFWRLQRGDVPWVVSVGCLEGQSDIELVRHVYIDEKPGYYDFKGSQPRLTAQQFTAQVLATMPFVQRTMAKTMIALSGLLSRLTPQLPGDAKQRGRCSCGEVTYRLGAAPTAITLCVCGVCRKQAGGVGCMWCDPQEIEFTNSSALGIWQSSTTGERGHCMKCGTSLLRRTKGSSQAQACPATLLDTSGLHGLSKVVHVDDGLPSVQLAGDVPHLTGA